MTDRALSMWQTLGVIAVLLMLAVAICGCSHNAVSYGDGLMLETTINPESYALGVSLRWGKILSVATRENSEVEMIGATEGSAGSGTGDTGAKSEATVRVKIGRQVTGYLVDAIAAGATPKELDTYVDSGAVPDGEKEEAAPPTQSEASTPVPPAADAK